MARIEDTFGKLQTNPARPGNGVGREAVRSGAKMQEFERSTGAFRVMDPGPTTIGIVEGAGVDTFERVSKILGRLPRRWQCKRYPTFYEALDEARAEEAEVFLVKLNLGDRTGLELVRRARRDGIQAVFIVISDYDDPALDEAALEAGADGFLLDHDIDETSLDRAIRYARRLRARVQGAERQRNRYDRALEALDYGVWDVDLRTLDVFLCDRAARALGIEAAPTIRVEGLAKLVDSNTRRAVLAAVSDCVHGKRSEVSVEMCLGDDPAHRRWLRIEGRPVVNEEGKPERIVGSIYDITSRKSSEQKLERRASRDPLTELPNRRLLEQRLGEAIVQAQDHDPRCGAAFGLLYIDLDGFKPVNDHYGHAAGDEVLKTVARRLEGCVRRNDTVARVGGDEFVLLMQGPLPAKVLHRMRAEIRAAIQEPIDYEGTTLRIDASVGLATEGQDGMEATDLLASADQSMYREKKDRKARRAANDAPWLGRS